jgi:hypothetical protein
VRSWMVRQVIAISYYYARLIIYRHFHGPTHGIRVRSLEKRRCSFYHPDSVVDTESRHARIVDNQLLISSAISKSHFHSNLNSLKKHIDEITSIGVCKHLVLARSWPGFTRLNSFVRNADAESGSRPYS